MTQFAKLSAAGAAAVLESWINAEDPDASSLVMTVAEFEDLFDQLVLLLEEANNHKYRLRLNEQR